MEIDYKQIGLRVGLEIHQQLNSPRKLFCFCEPKLIDREPDIKVTRLQRPTLSETGELDPTVAKEFKRRRKIIYETYEDLCLYEIDEKPPEPVDMYSLETALLLARIFKMEVPDVLFVSRKQYLDGSVPSGFQRTILVGLNGELTLSNGKKVRIDQLCLEEDAARKMGESENEVTFRVDRLGIPLVEITTAADLESPDEVLECALKIGAILRATKRVRRGIGTIRQDINVSIKEGARVEIKGVQYPDWFKPLIDGEIVRQVNLIEIAKELRSRGVSTKDIMNEKCIEVTYVFKNTKAKFIQKAISQGEKIYAIRLPGFKGILGREIQKGKRFGKEFAERVKATTGLAGIIHTDELPAYGISIEEKEKLFEVTRSDRDRDCIVIVVGPEQKALDAIEEIKERAILALSGPPPETRKANPDGTTEFERPLGGAARLYPDTDSPPIEIGGELISRVSKIEFRFPWDIAREISKEYELPFDDVYRIILSQWADLFEASINSGIDPRLVLRAINTAIGLQRKGFEIARISEEKFIEVLQAIASGKITKEALEDVLEVLSQDPGLSIEGVIERLGLRKVDERALRDFIIGLLNERKDFIIERREYAFKPLMGLVMKEFRGKIDGGVVAKILKEELDKFLNNV